MDWLNFAGVDVAPGGVETLTKIGGGNKGPRSGDDFAFFGWRWAPGERAEPLYAWRWCGIGAAQAAAQIHRLHEQFRFVTIMCDPNGGGLELYRNVKNPKQEGFDHDVTPLITEDDEQMAGVGEPVWSLFRRGERKIFGTKEAPGILPPYPGESHLPNHMHRIFKEAVSKKLVRLPALWPGWKEEMRFGTDDANFMRTWLNEHPGFQGDERSRAEIDLAIHQLIQVERENDRDGKPQLDKFGNFAFVSRYKKDSAYAMLYGYFALWLFMERTKNETEAKGEDGDPIISFNEVSH
jgi:hypothetical protein